MSAILEVAEGLRWTDPQLAVALAEHVARSAGDAEARSAAERSAVLALGQSDRPAELILGALPHLQEAERDGRAADAAVLRCELAFAAVRCGDLDAAEALLEPLAGGRVLAPRVRADALIAWAAARAARGDVGGVDAASHQVDEVLGEGSGDVRRLALQRWRARARRVAGNPEGALAVMRALGTVASGGDGGRETALLVADEVEVLSELGRLDEARDVAAPALTASPGATTALALGRLRCVLARRVYLGAGETEAAERVAREAEADLTPRGHLAQAAEAVDVLAEVAVRRGDARLAVDELRRAHAHALTAQEETTRARIALAVALAPTGDRARPPTERADEATPTRPEAADDEVPPGPAAAGADARSESDAGWGGGWGADPVTGPLGSRPDPPPSPAPVVPALPDASGSADPEPAASTVVGVPTPGDVLLGAAGDVAPDATATPADVDAAVPETSPGRRRGRYRDEAEPGELLAAALAAARHEGAAETEGAEDQPADSAAVSRSRRLARARARWEASDSWLSRRAAPTEGTADEHGPGETTGEPGGAMPALGDEPPADDASPRRERHRAPDDDTGLPTPLAADAGWGEHVSLRRLGDGDGLLGPRDEGADDTPWRDGLGLLGDDDRSGRGDEDILGPSPAARGTLENGHDRENGHDPLVDAARALDDPEPVTIAAQWGETVHDGAPGERARAAGPGGVDDELAQELALTLVDLLSEYQDPGVPLGATRSPGIPAAAPPRSDDRPPPASTRSPRPEAGPDGRTSAARGGRSGVPSARRADDSSPRLADLLADAMDAYHAADPTTAAADDGARR